MTDIAAFIEARYADDERAARLCDEFEDGRTHPYDPSNPCDPTRVLADLTAKRAILKQHGPRGSIDGYHRDVVVCETCVEGSTAFVSELSEGEPWPCPTVRALAAPFAAHPDYDPAWRPA